MFNKILFASDGSAESAKALALVKHIAIQDGADVDLVHVREYTLGVQSPMARAGHTAAAERELAVKQQARDLAESGIRVDVQVTASTPDTLAAALAERAGATGADTIVAGADLHPAFGLTTGRTVTQQLVQIAPCPVIVVPLRTATGRDTEAARTAAASMERIYR
jgi:nucleotide-binding universal stress UspA family protein